MVKTRKSGNDPDGKVVFEAPLGNLKGGWLELIKTQYINCGNALLQQEDGNADRFHFSFLFLLNMLPGGKTGKKRHRVYEAYKNLLETRLKEAEKEAGNDLTNEQKSRVRQEIELETLGHITDFVDTYIGIQERLTVDMVGFGVVDEIEEVEE